MAKIEVRQPTQQEIDAARLWPVWDCGVSEFDWYYSDNEKCLILSGKVEVSTDSETVNFCAGEWVVFPKGLSCRWKVIEPVSKHYKMG
jgi:uncharacterized protein